MVNDSSLCCVSSLHCRVSPEVSGLMWLHCLISLVEVGWLDGPRCLGNPNKPMGWPRTWQPVGSSIPAGQFDRVLLGPRKTLSMRFSEPGFTWSDWTCRVWCCCFASEPFTSATQPCCEFRAAVFDGTGCPQNRMRPL